MMNESTMEGSERKLSICIVSHNGYGAMAGGQGGFVGGVERQTSLLARWMADRGHQVSFLTWDEGGPAEEMIDGVRVIKICRNNAGLPGLRFIHPKWTGLNAALKKAAAEVYYHNCGECVTGQIALWCRRKNKPFVFSIASDADCIIPHEGLSSRRERILCQIGIRNADHIIAQTERQRMLLRRNYGLESTRIGMPCPEPADYVFCPRQGASFRRVLWVGRVWMEKRPEWFLEIAEACPSVQFDLIGPGFSAAEYGHSFSDDIFKRANTIRNLTVHGTLSRDEVLSLYQKADLLCCTSKYEGFPNTFLEAWSQGVPVVSSFDPDGLIAERRLGEFATNIEDLAAAIRRILEDDDLYAEYSGNCRAYFETSHRVDATLAEVLSVFEQAVTRKLA
jgi:glycosyltransferase involved in cell wall biosynthesis